MTRPRSLAGKTLFITGASRGIGLAIALRAARDGANIVIAGNTSEPDARLPGTIFTAAREVEAAGGHALPVVCDIRSEDHVKFAVDQAIACFGGIDACVNNASAISLTQTPEMEMRRYDLMQAVNARETFMVTKACIPHLRAAKNAHVLNLSPPLDMDAKWFAPDVAYTFAKMGMSLCTLGMARELESDGIAVNSLWPLTAIDTAAVCNVLGGAGMAKQSRTLEIMADAAHAILSRSSDESTGNFFIDDEVLRSGGQTDFALYSPHADGLLIRDFFIPDAVAAESLTPIVLTY